MSTKPLNRQTNVICIILLMLQAILLVWSSYVHSPTHLEVFHLPAGLSHWELSRYDLCRVNPPLVRKVASLPVYLMPHKSDYSSYVSGYFYRAEYGVGIDTMHANGTPFIWLVIVARWVCIPFILLGGYICYRWARELYGNVAGVVALLLWSFCPYILAHGSVITPDAHAAALGVTSAYLFWRWLKSPTWILTIFVGIMLGIAELSKFTLIFFYPIGLFLWLTYRFRFFRSWKWQSILREIYMGLVIITISIFVINIGYEFENTIKPLSDYRFQTSFFSGIPLDEIPKTGGNQYAETWLGKIPIPLPANYVYGLDLQKKDFEIGIFSYMCGEWKVGGWWYFHIYAMVIKLPLGTIGIFLGAMILTFCGKNFRSTWTDEFFLLLPVVVIAIVLSQQSGIGLHSRYGLPLLPFLFVWSSKIAVLWSQKFTIAKIAVIVFLCWSVGSTLYFFPHVLTYCNEIVGGPRNAYKHLAKSDSSWGQDLLLLNTWLKKNPKVGELRMAFSGPFDPRLAGLKFSLPPVGRNGKEYYDELPPALLGPQPGWFAIEVCFLLGGDPLSAANAKGGWDEPSKRPGYDLSYFQQFEPVDMIGYSIYIYHITLEEANRVRREMGLPEIEYEE